MLATFLCLATVAPATLLPYPLRGTLFTLEQGQDRSCNCMSVAGGGIVRDLLGTEERARFDDLIRRVADGWEESDQRQRARLLADYMEIGTLGRVVSYQDVVLSCTDGLRVRATRILTPRGESATLLHDLTTGAYLLRLYASQGSPLEFVDALRAALGADDAEATLDSNAAKTEAARTMDSLRRKYAKQLEVRLDSWDINGQVYLPLPDTSPPQVYAELKGLWTNFSPESGRRMRIAWGIFEAIDSNDIDCGPGAPVSAGPAPDPMYLFASQPTSVSCRPNDTFWMRYRSFEMPEGAPIATFFGKGWEPLPTDLSFPQSVRWLRRRR